MLRNLSDLTRYTLCACDGDIGSVGDFLFDDERWVVRYLVARTGSVFKRGHALISPVAFRKADRSSRRFHVSLTKDEVENSPDIEDDLPVSRQRERERRGYPENPLYWGYPGLWGATGHRGTLATAPLNPPVRAQAQRESRAHDDVHLRSANEVHDYAIECADEGIGHVRDFIVDDSWALRFIVVDTSNWWFGKKVLIAPGCVNRVSWESKTVYLALTRRQIEDGPEWDPKAPLNRAHEALLHDHHGRARTPARSDAPSLDRSVGSRARSGSRS